MPHSMMQIFSYKMSSWVHSLFRGRTKPRFIARKWGSSTIFIAVCVFLLNVVVSADHYDWKNAVPNRRYTSSHLASIHNAGPVPQRKHMQSYHHQQHYNKNHYHQHRSQYHHHHANIDALTKASQSASMKSPTWHNTNPNDPRMSLLFADSTSSSISSLPVPLPSPPLQALAPRPRSLSSLPLSSPYDATFSTNSTNTKSSDNSSKTKKKAKRNMKTKAIDSSTSSTTNAVTTTGMVPSHTELEAGTGRTFFLTPLLAYLFPVFIAQMFGMGMIPAAALITLPIFLLPLGITAAIFLI